MRSIRSGSAGAGMPDALDIVTLERMRFELRFPDDDRAQDTLLEEQIRSAAAFVGSDVGYDLVGLADDDTRLPALVAPIIVVARAFYDGVRVMPVAYDFLVRPLRRIV